MKFIHSLSTAVLASSVWFGATGCHEQSASPASEPLETMAVETIEVRVSSSPQMLELPGTVQTDSRAVIESRIPGRIRSVQVQMGDTVSADQLLIELEADEYRARLDQANSALELARREHQRIQSLFQRQAATRAELDAAESRLNQSRAAVEEASTFLNYARIASPLAGVVSRRSVDPGDQAMPGKPLLEIETPGNREFVVSVPESRINAIRTSDTYSISFNEGSQQLSATVSEISPSGDPQTRSWTVKLQLPDSMDLRSGQFGRIRIPGTAGVSIRIPSSAIRKQGQLEQVFVIEDNQARLRLIRTAGGEADETLVLSGLHGGEQLVNPVPQGLKDGQPVRTE